LRGQAAVEVLLILVMILIAVAAFLLAGQRGNEVSSIMSAARGGANRAIMELSMQYDCVIDIAGLNFDGGDITIYLTTGTGGPQDTIISDNVRNEALKWVHQTVNGTFPENAAPVRTKNYTYDIMVEITRVIK
jgi:uncharacterized protein (UPF0333 family)